MFCREGYAINDVKSRNDSEASFDKDVVESGLLSDSYQNKYSNIDFCLFFKIFGCQIEYSRVVFAILRIVSQKGVYIIHRSKKLHAEYNISLESRK
ncbi:MAG: hypothetical protein Q8S21_00920 [Candidatus Paracaedibacteraceae bacterium]|nr:hypothetical protein [Candidatus Paracaedibacteraceae bacterium]